MTGQPRLQRVSYQHKIAYDVLNTSDVFDPHNPALLSAGRTVDARRFVVVDENVARRSSGAIRDYFAHNRLDAKVVTLPGGEDTKSLDSFLSIAAELDSFPLHRRDEPIIAIGGGVLTDVVGFVAGTYRRGLPHINVPTTLMGYVDAAIGVKTAVNFGGHKNRLGAFAPPQRVLLDRAFLKTLPRRHILNGLCEVIKLAVIKDAGLFELLETSGASSVEANLQDDAGAAILDRSVQGMLDELQPNLLEEDLARRLDFGHTFSYGLETRPGTDLLHGEAVLLDIGLSVLIARARGLLSDGDTGRIFRLVTDLGLIMDPTLLDPTLLWSSLEERTCHRNGVQRVPLPHGLGDCTFVNDITLAELEAGARHMEDWIAVKNDLV